MIEHKEQINHWKVNQGTYFSNTLYGLSLLGKLNPDDGWLLFTPQNLTFILRCFVSCAHSHYSLDAHL